MNETEERELSKEEIDSATKNSKYLTTAPGYKSKFDMSEILVNGIIPQYSGAGDKLVCALEMGQFVHNNGLDLSIYGDNLAKFLASVDLPHRGIFTQQLDNNFLFALIFHDGVAELLKGL